MYYLIKNLHVTCVVLSAAGFLLRGVADRQLGRFARFQIDNERGEIGVGFREDRRNIPAIR